MITQNKNYHTNFSPKTGQPLLKKEYFLYATAFQTKEVPTAAFGGLR